MKKLTLLVLLVSFGLLNTISQTIELTFTAVNNTDWIQLDSIKVMNRTQGTATVLYWPDTTLSLNPVGIHEEVPELSNFHLYQNYPNPVIGYTNFKVSVGEIDDVNILVTDALGRYIIKTKKTLEKGCHEFLFKPGNAKIYFLTVNWKGNNNSIKIINAGKAVNVQCSLEYIGFSDINNQLKSTEKKDFTYSIGDSLLYIGYTDIHQSGMLDVPEIDMDYTLQFATNIPCPGTPTVDYEGQTYNTIQVYNQCWLKENLNVGTQINGDQNQSNNSIIEKYCYDNLASNCATYGGLYQWNEMMQYTTEQGAQGICPSGWHIPTDEEWKVLEGAVDSQYGIGDPIWEEFGYRGLDGGTNLKSINGWNNGGNGIDKFGFSVLPCGILHDESGFVILGEYGLYWSSEEDEPGVVWYRFFAYENPAVLRGETLSSQGYGYGVRCVKD